MQTEEVIPVPEINMAQSDRERQNKLMLGLLLVSPLTSGAIMLGVLRDQQVLSYVLPSFLLIWAGLVWFFRSLGNRALREISECLTHTNGREIVLTHEHLKVAWPLAMGEHKSDGADPWYLVIPWREIRSLAELTQPANHQPSVQIRRASGVSLLLRGKLLGAQRSRVFEALQKRLKEIHGEDFPENSKKELRMLLTKNRIVLLISLVAIFDVVFAAVFTRAYPFVFPLYSLLQCVIAGAGFGLLGFLFSKSRARWMTAFIVAICAFTAMLAGNAWFDGRKSISFPSVVSQTFLTHGKRVVFHNLAVRDLPPGSNPFQEELTFRISREEFERIKPGVTRIDLELGAGFFGLSWVKGYTLSE